MSQEVKYNEVITGRHYMMVNHRTKELSVVKAQLCRGQMMVLTIGNDFKDLIEEVYDHTFIEIKRPAGLEAYDL